MTGQEFERFCAGVLKTEGYTDIEMTQASGDQGVDILATRDGLQYAIQCKYYASAVGNSAVQQAYAGKTYYNCDVAMVMTNSTFTKSAVELAERTGVQLREDVMYTPMPLREKICRVINWIIGLASVLMAGRILFFLWAAKNDGLSEAAGAKASAADPLIPVLIYVAAVVLLVLLKHLIRKRRYEGTGYTEYVGDDSMDGFSGEEETIATDEPDEADSSDESEDGEILRSLGIERGDDPVPVSEVIPEGATLFIGATHEDRLDLIDEVVSKTSCNECQIILIDSQGFCSIYNGLRNLMIPAVTDSEQLEVLADWLNHEYAGRIKKFAENRVRSLEQYNSACEEDSHLASILVFLYDYTIDGAFIDSLELGVLLHGKVTGIHIAAFSNDSNPVAMNKAEKLGLVVRDI